MNARKDKQKQERARLNSQLEPVGDKTKKEKNEFVIELGKYFLDISKLTFGGMFLSAIMDVTFDMDRLIRVCAVVITFLAIFGLILIKYGNKKR